MDNKNQKIPEVQPRDWITIGTGMGVNAVVCQINKPGNVEVVYLDGSRAINEDAIWKNEHWEFKKQGPCGGYADNYQRLSDFVAILRRGRYR